MVGSVGYDPTTFRLRGGCSNQLSYKPILGTTEGFRITYNEATPAESESVIMLMCRLGGFAPPTSPKLG